jgi:ABC-type branched-subunit amino acid transport system ATPase component
MSLLEAKGIESGYGRTSVLFDIDLRIEEGEMVSLVGPNGAGKTTLLRTLSGILKAKKGNITFKDKSLNKLKPNQIVGSGIGYVLQQNNVFPNLTVMENLEMGAYLLSTSEFEDRLEDIFRRFPILEQRTNQKAGTLSGGERQMLAIASTIVMAPDLLMLDEPCGGLAPQMADEVFNKIVEVHKTGTAILWVVEREMEAVLKMVSRSYALESGQISFEGPGDDLLNDQKYQELILGGAA